LGLHANTLPAEQPFHIYRIYGAFKEQKLFAMRLYLSTRNPITKRFSVKEHTLKGITMLLRDITDTISINSAGRVLFFLFKTTFRRLDSVSVFR
jgi:hypothetical protein